MFRGHSEESKIKIGLASLGNSHNLGKKLSEEHKARITAGLTGKTYIGRKRKPHSEETKAKMSASRNALNLAIKLNKVEISLPL